VNGNSAYEYAYTTIANVGFCWPCQFCPQWTKNADNTLNTQHGTVAVCSATQNTQCCYATCATCSSYTPFPEPAQGDGKCLTCLDGSVADGSNGLAVGHCPAVTIGTSNYAAAIEEVGGMSKDTAMNKVVPGVAIPICLFILYGAWVVCFKRRQQKPANKQPLRGDGTTHGAREEGVVVNAV